MKVFELDMTDNTTQCPDSLELTEVPLCSCRIRSSSRGVYSSDIFNVYGVECTKVCGRIKGYQVGSTDAFCSTPNKYTNYVYGVSLTHGSSPKTAHLDICLCT